ncbi:hypothetical protein [Rhodococcus opacus]|nr:hypothetical protein [Rhodococcus opacus]
MIDLRVRRFFCDTIDCTAKTFAEQVPGLTKSRSRRTPVLGAMVTAIGLAVAGRAGARLATRLGVAVGRDTLLRTVRAMSDPKVGEVSVLGIDLSRPRNYPDTGIEAAVLIQVGASPDEFGSG